MISLTVKGLEEAEERLRRAGTDTDEGMRRAVRDASIEASGRLKDRFVPRVGYHPLWGPISPPGAFLARRSGQSVQRITPGGTVLERRLGDRIEFRAEVGSPDPHVAFHEDGGTIHGNPFLRIPTVYAQTPAGQDRFTGQSIRNIPDAFLRRSKAGNLWALQKRAPSRSEKSRSGNLGYRSIVPLFLLVRSTTHRGRGLFKTTTREMEPIFAAGVTAEVSRAADNANG